MATRRSTRERRKPQLYSVADPRADESDPENEDDVDEESEQEEVEEDEAAARKARRARTKRVGTTPQRKRSRPAAASSAKRPPKHPGSAKAKKELAEGSVQDAGVDADGKDQELVSLFDAVQEGKGLQNALTMWRERFDADETESSRELLNFIFHACGATNKTVADTDSMDNLDMNNLVETVVKELAESRGSYPIAPRTKGSKKVHRNYADFWRSFASECYESEILFSSNIVGKAVDWMTTLSSAEVRGIRHTAAVGVYSLANGLADAVATVTQQLAVVNRQLGVSNSRQSTPTRKSPNPRREALLKENKAMYETRLQQLLAAINLVFNGVFAHRYRDVMPEIRAESVLAIGHWIYTIPDHYLKDNFLKYLGWLLNDKAALVRFHVVEALQSLYEQELFAPKLELFTARFLPRYLQLCDDVDDDVVEATIRLLIAVDKSKMITTEVELQSVERLVFDAEHSEIRKAAAEFVCLQYDAFGVALQKNESLNKEQLYTQAIALVEFAEEYIQNHNIPPEAIETLVDAFWGLDDCRVLSKWKLLTNLLLMDKSAPDLTGEQQTILLAILIAAIRKLLAEHEEQGSSVAAKKSLATDQEEITVTFCREIPSMLTSFQSDADKLTLLTQLIPLLSLRGDVVGQHIGQITEIAEKMKRAYLLHSDEALLGTFAVSFSHLLQAEYETVQREVAVVMHELVQTILDRLSQQLEEDPNVIEKLVEEASADTNASSSKKSKKRGKKKTSGSKEVADAEYGLRISLCRLASLMSFVNIREYLPSSVTSAAATTVASTNSPRSASDAEESGETAAVIDKTLPSSRLNTTVLEIVRLVQRRAQAFLKLGDDFRNPETFKHALMVVYHHVLWLTVPIFTQSEAEMSGSAMMDTESSSRVATNIQRVVLARERLEEALVSILSMHLEPASREQLDDGQSEMKEIEFEDEDALMFVRAVQHLAFITFCDARCLFVEKLQSFPPPFDALQWNVPEQLVLLAQSHFENEMETTYAPHPDEADPATNEDEDTNTALSADEKKSRKRAWDEEQKQKAELLAALGRVALCNPNNKRQAASVLARLTSSEAATQDVIKQFSKQVKAEAPVRYLEIQMTALRRSYSGLVVWKEELAALEANTPDAADEIDELTETIESTTAELEDLAKRFAKSMGVGKVTAALRAPFLRFLCEGVRYSLERKSNFAFLASMRPYISHLDRPTMRQLHGYFEQALEALKKRGVVRDTNGDDDSEGDEWRVVDEFETAISAGSASKHNNSTSLRKERASARSSASAIASIAEGDEEKEAEVMDTARESKEDGDHQPSNEAQMEDEGENEANSPSTPLKRKSGSDFGDGDESDGGNKRTRHS